MKKMFLILIILTATLFGQRLNQNPSITSKPDILRFVILDQDTTKNLRFDKLFAFLVDSGLVRKVISDTISSVGTGHKYNFTYNHILNPLDDQSSYQWGNEYNYVCTPESLNFLPAGWVGDNRTLRNKAQNTTWQTIQMSNESILNFGNLDNAKIYTATASQVDTVADFLYGFYTLLNQYSNSCGVPYTNYFAHLRLKSQNWNYIYNDESLLNTLSFSSGWHSTESSNGKPARTGTIRGYYFDAYNVGAGSITDNVTGFYSNFDNNGELGNYTQFKSPTITGDGDFAGNYYGLHIEAQPEFDGDMYGVLDESDSSKFKHIITNTIQVSDSIVTDQKIEKFLTVDKGTAGQIAMSNGSIGISFQSTLGKAYLANAGTLGFDWDDSEVDDDLTINTTKNITIQAGKLFTTTGNYGLKMLSNDRFTLGNSAALDMTWANGWVGYQTNETLGTALMVYGKYQPAAVNNTGYSRTLALFSHIYPSYYTLFYAAYDASNYIYAGGATIKDLYNLKSRMVVSSNNTDVDNFYGTYSELYSNGYTGVNIDNAFGMYNYTFFSGDADVTNLYGIYVKDEIKNSGDIENRYGIYINPIISTAGTFANVNNFGLYIGDQTNLYTSNYNYAIYAEGPKSYIEKIETDQIKINDFTIEDIDVTPDGRFYMIQETGGTYYTPRYAASDTTGKW